MRPRCSMSIARMSNGFAVRGMRTPCRQSSRFRVSTTNGPNWRYEWRGVSAVMIVRLVHGAGENGQNLVDFNSFHNFSSLPTRLDPAVTVRSRSVACTLEGGECPMDARRGLTIVAVAIAAMSASAASVSAQIITATVSGSVRDGTGAALPGATVTLESEKRGTKLDDAVTTANCDFVFPNVAADAYVIQASLDGFKTLRRAGITVSPGDRLVVPALVLEVGALAETVTVTAESPLIQLGSGERSFTVATESVQNLPISNRSFVQLASIAPGVGGGTNPARIGGGGAN